MRNERLQQPLLAHVSYRLGDKIYWTKKPVQLPKNEPVMTDGRTSIRERCGNLISDGATRAGIGRRTAAAVVRPAHGSDGVRVDAPGLHAAFGSARHTGSRQAGARLTLTGAFFSWGPSRWAWVSVGREVSWLAFGPVDRSRLRSARSAGRVSQPSRNAAAGTRAQYVDALRACRRCRRGALPSQAGPGSRAQLASYPKVQRFLFALRKGDAER